MTIQTFTLNSEAETKQFGAALSKSLKGGEALQLVGDVGAGKTTLVKGIAEGMGIAEPVQSPSFTISRVYEKEGGVRLAHYDFYRLAEAGIMANELQEDIEDPTTVTIIEWAEIVEGVLPKEHITISIAAVTESSRELTLSDPEGILDDFTY